MRNQHYGIGIANVGVSRPRLTGMNSTARKAAKRAQFRENAMEAVLIVLGAAALYATGLFLSTFAPVTH